MKDGLRLTCGTSVSDKVGVTLGIRVGVWRLVLGFA